MKRKHFFRHWLQLFVQTMLFLFGCVPVHSQSAILSGNQHSEFSIIRNYKKNVDITYNVMLDTLSFNYVDRNTMTTHSVNILNMFQVNDFVVFHDSVFFCGNQGQKACCGYFNINDVFFNNGNISYYVLHIPIFLDPSKSKLFSLGKIDVTTARSGASHMLMTGWGLCLTMDTTSKAINAYYPGAIVEVWMDSAGNNNIRYTVDSINNYVYTDVAFTDSFAVITASTTSVINPNSHNLFYYYSPLFSNKGYLDSWGSPTSNTPMMTADASSLQLTPFGAAMIHVTKMDNNMFATACTNHLSGLVAISIYNNPTQQPIIRFDVTDPYSCQEMVYNKRQGALYFIGVSTSPNLYHITAPYAISLKLTDRSTKWLSIDNTDNDTREIISGWDPSYVFIYPKKYWLFDEQNLNPCFQKNQVPNADLLKIDHSRRYIQNIFNWEVLPNTFQPKASIFNLEYICR